MWEMNTDKRFRNGAVFGFWCLIIPILLPGCINIEQKGINDCFDRVEKLTDRRKQWIFLDSIGKLDQRVRQEEIAALQLYGYDSEEHKNAMTRMVETDASNLACIEAYLERYGHPTLSSHGLDCSAVPGLVIHHAPGGLESRVRNFKYLYQGYLDRDVYEEDLIMVLNRAYQLKYGERIEWDRPYRSEEELDTLIQSLGLREEAERIQSGLDGL